jgi:HK97 family phage major capsid protein
MSTATLDKSMLAAAKADLEQKNADIEGIASGFKTDEKGRFEISREEYTKYKTAVMEAAEAKSFIDAVEKVAEGYDYLNAPERPSEAALDAGAGRLEGKSLGDAFTDAEAYQRAAKAGFDNVSNITVQLEGKSLYNFAAGSHEFQALGTNQDLGIAERAYRKMHIRDLFPKSTTKASVLTGLRELGWTNNAAQVAQRYAADGVSPATGADDDVFGRAPKSKLRLEPVLFPVAEIKHSLDAHVNILADDGRLKSFINNRLVEGVKYAEDNDLLHSTGSGEKITGLFNSPGVQAYTGLATDGYSVQIRRAITKGLLAEYEMNGIVLSPTMWEAVEVEEDSTGAFRVAVSVAIGAEKRVWRLRVVETTAMDDAKFLVGAFGTGAQLHDRESVKVVASTEHGTNFTDGACTFLATERLALEVARPESFVVGSWTVPA